MSLFTLYINTTPITLETNKAVIESLTLDWEGTHRLVFYQYDQTLAAPPHPWACQPCTLVYSASVVFAGFTGTPEQQFVDGEWRIVFTALGLRNLCTYVPLTDDNGMYGYDTSIYNLPATDPDYVASRAGRTVGQIITDVLTGVTTATLLNSYGIGAYTSLSPPTLPSATVTDLGNLSVIPQSQVILSGEDVFAVLENFMRVHQPNHRLTILPDGTFRILDLTEFSASTLTVGSDPIDPVEWTRQTDECYQRVIVRGSPLAMPWNISLAPPAGSSAANGGLEEAFAWGSYSTNAAAIAAWNCSTDWGTDGTSSDNGTCSCTDTTHVVVTSADSSLTWASDFWDQNTGAHGVLQLFNDVATGLTIARSARIIANTSLSAGGTSTLTLDIPLDNTSYNYYKITGYESGANEVWRKYQPSDSTVRASLAKQFAFPVPFKFSNGTAETLTSYPMSVVYYNGAGFPLPFTIDYDSGAILFVRPTNLLFGDCSSPAPPDDIQMLLAVNVDVNQTIYPANSGSTPVYGGTSNTVDGLQRTKIVTFNDWTDPINSTAMATYAEELFTSLSDAIIEFPVHYYGLYVAALSPGIALNITGSTYTYGLESSTPVTSSGTYPGIAVRRVEVLWNQDGAVPFTTIMTCSNRKDSVSSSDFSRPPRVGSTWGQEFNPFQVPALPTNQGGGEGEEIPTGRQDEGGGNEDFFPPAPEADEADLDDQHFDAV